MLMNFLRYAKIRLAERSTWQGLSGALAGSGITLTGNEQMGMITAGVALFALVNIFTPDKQPKA